MKEEKIMKNVIKKIRPSIEERKEMRNITNKVLEVSEKILTPYSAKPMLCGSVAKGTWIKPEMDLFLLFNKLLPRKNLEDYGLQAAKDIISALDGKYRIAYTEHPYITGVIKFNKKNYAIDVVPCYDISSEKIKSAVDRTPHHVKFILERLPEGLKNDVRLLKKFCIAQDCYGADLKTQGFSGYLCELLIINYGRFLDVIKNASKWKAGIKIDIINSNSKKFKDPLVFIDPVDPNRNVAAAVSIQTFYRFVKACKEFLENPSEKFFEKEIIKPYKTEEIEKEMESRGTRWYLIKFKKPDVLDDILYSQMRRCVKRIKDILEDEGFKILRNDFFVNEFCVLIFEMQVWQLPRIKKHIGPNVFSKHADEFLQHYKEHNVFIENDNWITEYQRKHSFVLEFLKDLFSLSENELKENGFPSKIAESIHKHCEIASGGDVIRMIRRSPKDFRVFLRKYFEKDLNIV